MRITNSMLSGFANRINPFMYSGRTAKMQAANKRYGTAGTMKNPQRVNNNTIVDKYIKIGETAEKLRSSANILGSKNRIFENARNTGSKGEVLSQAKEMINSYNSTMSAIKNDNSSLNRVYRQLMGNAAFENRETLAAVGISVNNDNTLSIDENKFKASSIDDLEAAFGSESRFTSRVGSMAENVSNNAISTATNLNSAYSAHGAYSAYSNPYMGLGYGNTDYLSALLSRASRYNFWI